ncbi:hypothetical protein F5879DRAFT_1072231 [Lentinula edodes]|nr:hypothetical protein F5879DRAFT_1072231 [Lentinula edodes]
MEGLVESPKKMKKKAGVQAKPARKSEVGGEKGPLDMKQKPRTRGSTASLAARLLASTRSAATIDHEDSGDEPLTTSLLLSPMSEGLEVTVDSLGNMTMEAHMEKEFGIDLNMTSVAKVVQVASKLKKMAIAVGGQQMEMQNAFRDETSTLHQDLGKLEEVQNVEKVALKMPTGSEIEGRLVVALKGVKEDFAETCGRIQGEMRTLQGIVKNNVKVVSKEARDDGRAVRAELKNEIHKCNEQKKKAEVYTAKVEDVVKDLVARIEVLERQNRELEGKNRDLEHRVERVAQEKRQEEEAQVKRMSESVREVMGYGTQRKRLGKDDMGYEGHSGKFPHGNSAESVHDMGGRMYGAPLPHLAQPPTFAPTTPARDKQELKLAIGVFQGQYATAGVGDQIALIAKSVPRSVIPRDVRRDEYRFGVLVMTFWSYNDRDAFT